ncbi:MAG: circadian clock KaiB family protein [Myxococcota bacterium]
MKYILRLYVSGTGGRSLRAIQALEAMCASHVGIYEMEIVDVLEEPDRAEADKIMATPTLIKVLPPPMRKIIGDLSEEPRVLLALDIEVVETEDKE